MRTKLEIGSRVRLTKAMGVKVGALTFTHGAFQRKDGEYYYIVMDFDPSCICERYYSEIEAFKFIEKPFGEWQPLTK